MDVRGMHYDFKRKLNRLDSQKNRNLLIPEIDWILTEAQEVFIKAIAVPRYRQGLGFEINQRSIDDIKTIVKKQFFENNECIVAVRIDDFTYKVALPTDYSYKTSARVIATKSTCTNIILKARSVQDDDLTQETSFSKPSFEWRETNIMFSSDGILIKSDGSFVPTHLCLNYIKKAPRIHNAQDTATHQYYLPDKTTLLTGSQNCVLPAHTHSEIVDIAVLLATTDMLSDFQIKQFKTTLTE